jgi:4-hydroxy-tetrahydrodipicolinate synthase
MDWIEFCNDMPINGYLMATPMYTKPGISGQTEWFNRLLNKSKHEAMLYNIPGRAGIKLHSEVVKNLKDHENFVALKDSSGVVDSLVEYKIAAPNISIFCGDDYMMPSTAIEGAAGLVSVISNAFPDETRKYVEYALRGNKMKSKIWWQACKALFAASNPIPIKALMKDIGLIKSDDVRLPLSLEDLVNRSDLMKYFDLIKDWGHNLKDEI